MAEDHGVVAQTLSIGPLQEALWVFWKLNPTSAAYNVPEVIHLQGDLDLAATRYAFDATVRRHEALRTTFRETESGVVQVVSSDPDPRPVKVVDLRGVPEAERADRLAAVLHAEANAPFDLSTGPPIRLTAIRRAGARTSLLIVVHHIVCDGTSMSRLLEDFAAFHRAARSGRSRICHRLPRATPRWFGGSSPRSPGRNSARSSTTGGTGSPVYAEARCRVMAAAGRRRAPIKPSRCRPSSSPNSRPGYSHMPAGCGPLRSPFCSARCRS
jgi:hypothetical protein